MQSCHSKSEQHDATPYDENSSPESEVVTLDSPQPSTSSASTQTPFEHSLKIINPSRMSEFTRVNIRGRKHCCTLEEVKKLITDNFPHGENLPDYQSEKMTEVDKIYSKLQEEHKTGYSPEQLRAWAHLLQMGKHDSYTQPSDKPFFRGRKRAAAVCTSVLT